MKTKKQVQVLSSVAIPKEHVKQNAGHTSKPPLLQFDNSEVEVVWYGGEVGPVAGGVGRRGLAGRQKPAPLEQVQKKKINAKQPYSE